MKCKYFKNHLQLFWNSFQNAKICWQAFAKGETLNYCHINISNLLQQCQWCFLVKMINNGKIKTNCLEECKELAKYQTRYFIKTFIFIISACCFYHAVHLVLQLLIPRDPNVERFKTFVWYFVILLDSYHHSSKWGPVCEYWG